MAAVVEKPDPFAVAADVLDPPEWAPVDRPPLEDHQLPPEGDWDLWLLEAGRGAGKTEACARYFAAFMHQYPGSRGRIIAPTFGDAVESCITGPSGLQSVDPDVKWLPSAPGGAKVVWPNGSEALVIGTPFPRDVDRLRAGGNRHIDWWEEMAANAQLASKTNTDNGAWDQAQLGLRLGPHPRSIASTTPRNTAAYRAVRNSKALKIAFKKATMFDNPHNSKEWVEAMRARYEGTRLGRQELQGELLEDVEGALWKPAIFDASRVDEHPDLSVVVVAVDPAASSGPSAADTGIIVAGIGTDGETYIMDDRTCHLSPEGWGQRVVRTFHGNDADRVVPEVNHGGEMVESTIRAIDPDVPVKPVRASRGKEIRAEPVATLFGDGKKRKAKVHMVGSFPELEDQCCTWVPGEGDSPDRLDALVWAVTDLMLGKQSNWRPL